MKWLHGWCECSAYSFRIWSWCLDAETRASLNVFTSLGKPALLSLLPPSFWLHTGWSSSCSLSERPPLRAELTAACPQKDNCSFFPLFSQTRRQLFLLCAAGSSSPCAVHRGNTDGNRAPGVSSAQVRIFDAPLCLWTGLQLRPFKCELCERVGFSRVHPEMRCVFTFQSKRET